MIGQVTGFSGVKPVVARQPSNRSQVVNTSASTMKQQPLFDGGFCTIPLIGCCVAPIVALGVALWGLSRVVRSFGSGS